MPKRAYGPQPIEFTPQNPSKYKGTHPIISRSSPETQFMMWCDLSTSVLEWGSESTVVPYQDMSRKNINGQGSIHRYYVDFFVKIKKSDGSTEKLWIEIKPFSQTRPPERGRKSPKVYAEAVNTWIKNACKWKAATIAAKQKGARFIILTEKNMTSLK